MKRTHSYSGDTARAAVRAFTSAEVFMIEHPGSGPRPIEVAQTASGGASKSEIYLWQNTDMSDKAIKNRLSKRGSKPVYPEELKKLAVGYVLNHRLSLHAVDRALVVDFFFSYLNMKVHAEYVSKLMGDYGLSFQKAMDRESRMVDKKVVEDAIEFLEEFRREGWRPDNTYFMDETGAWSNIGPGGTYNPINSYEIL